MHGAGTSAENTRLALIFFSPFPDQPSRVIAAPEKMVFLRGQKKRHNASPG